MNQILKGLLFQLLIINAIVFGTIQIGKAMYGLNILLAVLIWRAR